VLGGFGWGEGARCVDGAEWRGLQSSVHDINTLRLDGLWEFLGRDGAVRRLLQIAREEDLGAACGAGDITSRVMVEDAARAEARVAARQAGVVAGVRAVPMLLDVFGCAERVELDVRAADGQRVEAGAIVANLSGPARDVLAVERTLLNLLARLSGIATGTARMVALVAGTKARVLDTRKTTPGLRALEKYAVRCGGGFSHRLGLYDALLIKDNHLAHVPLERLGAHVSAAVGKAHAIAAEHGGRLGFAECEVDTLDQFRVIVASGGCGLDVVLLDNMSIENLRDAVRLRDLSKLPLQLEASGGVHERSIRSIAETGIDRISVGALTHQAVSLDFGLDFDAAA